MKRIVATLSIAAAICLVVALVSGSRLADNTDQRGLVSRRVGIESVPEAPRVSLQSASSPRVESPESPLERASAYDGVSFFGKPVGSEGFSKPIWDAYYHGLADDRFKAYQQIGTCLDIESDVERHISNRATETSARARANLAEMLEHDLAVQRACQSVGSDIVALRSKLLAMAVEGGALGAAAVMLAEPGKLETLSSTERSRAITQLRYDADSGHLLSIIFTAFNQEKFRLSDVDAKAYLGAYKWISEHPPGVSELGLDGTPIQDMVTYFHANMWSLDEKGKAEYELKVKALIDAHQRLRQQQAKN